MGKDIIEKVKNIPQTWWILAAILVVGIFLRTWQHHDWLRFNADQGRDAQIVSEAVEGTTSWPLLGPKAGGTQFRLGPAFYWFEIAAANVFGNAPDKMAYPDLFFSILAIPLLFLFLRKYFEKYAALALTAIFAVSAYAVFYSRFAWNPNSMPFWTMLFLYAAHEVISPNDGRKPRTTTTSPVYSISEKIKDVAARGRYLWAALAGLALGVDVQLHTTMLVVLPLMTIIVFAYFTAKNKKILKYFVVILAVALLANGPQLANECRTNWKNSRTFFRALKVKDKSEDTALNNGIRGTSCWIQSNLYIISGYEISDKCDFSPKKNAAETAIFILGAIFFAGGLVLGLKYLISETDPDRRSFLGIIFVFAGLTFLAFWKMAQELSVRFYLPLVFLPLFFAGFWGKFLGEKIGIRKGIFWWLSVPLIFLNLVFVQRYFLALAAYTDPKGGSSEVMILKEAEVFANFIVSNSADEKKVYISGDGELLQKGFRSLDYLTSRKNIDLSLIKDKSALPEQYFHIIKIKSRTKPTKDGAAEIIRRETFGKYEILLVRNSGTE